MRSYLEQIQKNFVRAPGSHAVDLFSQREYTTYQELGSMVESCRAQLNGIKNQPIGILCQKNAEAYAAVLAVLMSGNYFVPLNPKLPSERLRKIIGIAEIKIAFADARNEALASTFNDVRVYVIDKSKVQLLPTECVTEDPSQTAYLMFTSGSTGEPKGVEVTRANLTAVMKHVDDFTTVDSSDRVSQIFDLSFDLSIGEIIWCLAAGACLCPLEAIDSFSFAEYMNHQRISIFGSAPSFLQSLLGAGLLKNKKLESVRFSLFCGEKLTGKLCRKWAQLAPRSSIENLYGPTETTLYVTRYTWHASDEAANIPIGKPLSGNRIEIVDAELNKLSPGSIGEICVCGRQLALGYFDDVQKTEASFIYPRWDSHRWYRTGDLGYQDLNGNYVFVGRNDTQVKVLGSRIELGEVESLLDAADTQAQGWIVFPFSRDEYGSVTGLAAITTFKLSAIEIQALLDRLADQLPRRQIPSAVFYIKELPLSPHGKLDRKQLEASLVSRQLEQIFPGTTTVAD